MTFLQQVAKDIIGKYGHDLSDIAVVFPNKRAALFLNKELVRLSGRPLWSPAYITISELFRQHSTLTVADPILTICCLYRSFLKVMGDAAYGETLDQFYGWGQLLLADFDDLDKNMADADRVFSHVRSLEQLSDLSYLTDEQKAALARFFKDFDEQSTVLKTRFLSLWDHLDAIYHDFRDSMRQRGIAYEGMLYRDVAEDPQLNFRYRKYLFVGFNVIQQVEQTMFTRLKDEGRAAFYWDYDHYYTQQQPATDGRRLTPNEAGVYIRQHLSRFPNELPDLPALYDRLSQLRDITYVSAATATLQAHYVSTWLRERNRIADGSRTAIVMCDESLLPTIIHCIPDDVESVNVTTGFPLQQTRIATEVIQRLSDKKLPKDNLQAVRLLKEMVKGHTDDADDAEFSHFSILHQESLFRMYTLLNRLESLIASGDLQTDRNTLQRLLRQLLASTSIPFHGEPAVGLQVMGVLETRNLDFDHVLILSCNEGNMPKGVNDASFIPHIIRQAYGLTTIDNKVAVYSYYFHRMIQRAQDVTILYSNATEGVQTGEMSRFMTQLMVELRQPIRRLTLQAGSDSAGSTGHPKTISKDESVMQRLQQLSFLTPTALSNYLRCPLRFFYRYVCDIKEPDDSEDGKIDNRVFGNVFHRAAQLMYEQLLPHGEITADDIDRLLLRRQSAELLQRIISQAVAEELFHLPEGTTQHPPLNGMQLISTQVVETYLRQLLRIDRELTPFSVICHEKDVSRSFTINGRTITLGGRIDRIDQVGDTLRIVDYKTGGSQQRPLQSLDEVFDPANVRTKHSDYYLQAMFYSRIVQCAALVNNGQRITDHHPLTINHQPLKVSPALLFIQHAGQKDYSPVLSIGGQPVSDIAVCGDTFDDLLRQLLTEILDPATSFQPTSDQQRCLTCPYRALCYIED